MVFLMIYIHYLIFSGRAPQVLEKHTPERAGWLSMDFAGCTRNTNFRPASDNSGKHNFVFSSGVPLKAAAGQGR
jgi:hypothetical protein